MKQKAINILKGIGYFLAIGVTFFMIFWLDKGKGDEDDNEQDKSACKFDDGQHSATIKYYNPDTDYRGSYTLDVQVDNCEVIEIDFPKGGWLDIDHINPTEIDEDGNASIEDDKGRTFEVHIDN